MDQNSTPGRGSTPRRGWQSCKGEGTGCGIACEARLAVIHCDNRGSEAASSETSVSPITSLEISPPVFLLKVQQSAGWTYDKATGPATRCPAILSTGSTLAQGPWNEDETFRTSLDFNSPWQG